MICRVFSGVGDNDEKFSFLVFIGLPKGAVFRGNRIGLDLTNFNIWVLFLNSNCIKTIQIYFFDSRITNWFSEQSKLMIKSLQSLRVSILINLSLT